jgi:phenylalanyl-tRNA synthetase beta chain
MERATSLLFGIVGGKPGPVIEQTARRHLPRAVSISLRVDRVERLLGMNVPAKIIESILKRLGMKLKKSRSNWIVTPPSYRFDIEREADLIEEIARIHGYDKLPTRHPRIQMSARPVAESGVSEPRLRAALMDRDYQEVITYSFVDPKIQTLVDPGIAPLALANPISADMAVMRTSLWPGLLQTILYNQNRQQTRVRLFEIGRTFLPRDHDVVQERMLGGAVYGDAWAEQWGAPRRAVDLYDAKADIEALFALAGMGGEVLFRPGKHPALHPGQTVEIQYHGQAIGLLGLLHPAIQAHLGLSQPVVLYEFRQSALGGERIAIFKEFSRFPSIRRDIAIMVNEAIPAQAVLDCVQKTAGSLLVNLELFDEYRGKGIDSGRKSLALGLTLQHSSRTLNEADVEQVMAEVITTLGTELGALPRQ